MRPSTLFFLCFVCITYSKMSFSSPSATVSSLLEQHADAISQLKKAAEDKFPASAPTDSMFYLRYCLKEDPEKEERLLDNLQWRAGEGKHLVEAAKKAVEAATSSGGSWNNKPVMDMAPHAEIIKKYIGPTQCLTTTLLSGDLCFCINAAQVDDVALMNELSVDQMADFFFYCREVNALVANSKSISSDRVVTVITVNNLSGVKLVGGEAAFRQALSKVSKRSVLLYPCLSGPTFLMNLHKILLGLVKLFLPLMPKEARKRLRFEKGPLKDVTSLIEISPGPQGNPATREKFLNQMDALLKK